MATLLLLLAIIGGIVVGDLVLENTTVGDVTMLHHPITGYSQGLLLAMAAALGFVLGLLVVVSVSTTRTRRARRKQRRTAGRALHSRMAELERENARLREELARDERVGHLGELASPADLGSTSRAGAMADHRVTAHPTSWWSAAPSLSTRRPGGRPGSVATRAAYCCPPMTAHALGRPPSVCARS
jgi:hypothetical protein